MLSYFQMGELFDRIKATKDLVEREEAYGTVKESEMLAQVLKNQVAIMRTLGRQTR